MKNPTNKNMLLNIQSWKGKTPLDFNRYKAFLRCVASLSELFSSSQKPYIDYRVAEKLFVFCHPDGCVEDLSRKDNSFDALYTDKNNHKIGIGIKTFVGGSNTNRYKVEKVAEFTKQAQTEKLADLHDEELAYKVAELRNKRVQSNAKEYGIDIDNSVYNCLIRTNNSAFLHEEPYPLVNQSNITVTTKHLGIKSPVVSFYDGLNEYKYNRSKNVLLKKFNELDFLNSDNIPITVIENPFTWLETAMETLDIDSLERNRIDNRPFVVLPLYSTKNHEVPERSGINQWNAGGRKRSFGEAYIPVPRAIHALFPNFFPAPIQDNGKLHGAFFSLRLPNGLIETKTHLCQDNFKALMAERNVNLAPWLYEMIDGSMQNAEKRKPEERPYTYKDLIRIGKDSVAILKNEDNYYDLEMLPLNSYDKFIELATTDSLPNYSDFLEMLEDNDSSDN